MKDNFESALRFALDVHSNQLDSGWTPYIQHVMGVWSRLRFENMTTQIAALLHDTVEDTSVTLDQIHYEFGEDVAEIIRILTHTKGVPYKAYIEAIALSGNRSAILIKIADLDDNSSEIRLQRLPAGKEEYFRKRAQDKYGPARNRLAVAFAGLKY